MMTNNNRNLNAAINELFAAFRAAQQNLSNAGNGTFEEYTDAADKSANGVIGAFFKLVDTTARLTGIKYLNMSVARILDNGCIDGKKSIPAMAAEIRKLFKEEADLLDGCMCEDEAWVLRELVENKSVWNMFAGTLAWIAGKVVRKVKKIMPNINLEKHQVMAGILKKLQGVAHVVGEGAKLVFNAVKLAISFIGATVITLADYIISGIKWILRNTLGRVWKLIKDRFMPDYIDDFEDDEFFEDDEYFEEVCPESPNGASVCEACDNVGCVNHPDYQSC